MGSLSIGEIEVALNSLPHHSCPGEDGLSVLFFKRYWETVKYQVREGFQGIVTSGILPQRFGEGLIFLIPKGGGQPDEIQKWRPITILNTIYKLLAKTISLRLQPMLPQLLHVSQTGFIKERSILNTKQDSYLLGAHSTGKEKGGKVGPTTPRLRKGI